MAVLLVLVVTGAVCPLVYGFNDDAMISSILSGAYTGTPDGHAVYLSYPLSGLFSLLYRICDRVAWFPLFFAVALAGCCYVVLLYAGRNIQGKVNRVLAVLLGAALLVLLLFSHYVVLHYTIMAAVLGATALFVLLAGDVDRPAEAVSLTLLLLCYMVRSQVFYMTLPFLLVALLWKLSGATQQKWAEKWKKCVRLPGMLCVGFLLLLVINGVMYGSAEWRAYLAYNDARTEVYDYAGLLPYDSYQSIYDDLGISKEQYEVMNQYGTVLDGEVDAETLAKLAEVTMEENMRGTSVKEVVVSRAREYYYRTLHQEDAPYNYVVLALYGLVLIACVLHRQWLRLALVFCLGGGRSLIWLYLMVKGRYPERVTISLYLIEGFLLAGMLVSFARNQRREKEKTRIKNARLMELWESRKGLVLGAALAAVLVVCIPATVSEVKSGMALAKYQQGIQENWEQLREYMGDHEDSFYYLDVYSVVAVTGQQYRQTEYENYMLLGGWMTRSPLLQDKQETTGFAETLEALTEGEKVYLVVSEKRSCEWIEEYMKGRGCEAEFILRDKVGEFGIYSIE